MSDCPLANFACDTCVYRGDCMPGKVYKQNQIIITLLEEINKKLG